MRVICGSTSTACLTKLQAAQKASDERRAAAEKRLKDAELRCEALEEEYTKYRKNQRRREDGGVFAGADCWHCIAFTAASRFLYFPQKMQH